MDADRRSLHVVLPGAYDFNIEDNIGCCVIFTIFFLISFHANFDNLLDVRFTYGIASASIPSELMSV